MKGIILAGGSGTRLSPLTKATSKQLLPVYNKPMIYYPMSILMLAGVTEYLIITTPHDQVNFKRLLGDGSQWGVSIDYAVQEKPNGLAETFLIGEEFIQNEPCALVLGDNFLYRDGLQGMMKHCTEISEGAIIFGYHVSDPSRYGVIELEKDGELHTVGDSLHKALPIKSIEEKPEQPKSNIAAIGLYFYDNTVVEKAKSLKPSKRGELEITDLNNLYLAEGKLEGLPLGRGAAWFDMGTPDSLLEAGQFVKTLEKCQGFQIANLDDIAKHMSFTK